MADIVTAEITGVSEAIRSLEVLGTVKARRATRKIVTKANSILARAAKANTSRASGLSAKSIGSKVKTYRMGKNQGVTVGITGPRRGFKRTVAVAVGGGKLGRGKKAKAAAIEKVHDPARTFHLLEKGRKRVQAKKKQALYGQGRFWGKSVGPAAGQRPLGRALESSQGQIVAAAQSIAAAELAKGA